MNIKVLNMLGEEVSTLEVKDSVFNVEYNKPLIHQVVVAQLANLRQGTHSALTRSEVRGHAKKPWKQKHTGNARHGSTKGPQWRGGGIAFAVKPRDYSKKINKSMKVAAFKSALSTKLRNNELFVLDKLAVSEGKTKEFASILDDLKLNKSVLFVDTNTNELVTRASSNIGRVNLTTANLLNVYELVKNDKVVLTVEAVKAIEEVYA